MQTEFPAFRDQAVLGLEQSGALSAGKVQGSGLNVEVGSASRSKLTGSPHPESFGIGVKAAGNRGR